MRVESGRLGLEDFLRLLSQHQVNLVRVSPKPKPKPTPKDFLRLLSQHQAILLGLGLG